MGTFLCVVTKGLQTSSNNIHTNAINYKIDIQDKALLFKGCTSDESLHVRVLSTVCGTY